MCRTSIITRFCRTRTKTISGIGDGAPERKNAPFPVERISDPDRKSEICRTILTALPAWFGDASAVESYAENARESVFFAAFAQGNPVGFLALKFHNEFTAEISVTGVAPEFHQRGIGRALVSEAEKEASRAGGIYLTVKTLDASAKSSAYDKTRAFYRAVGFVPIEVFPDFWDKENPCLLMLKRLERKP